jgi:hypothetical protein
MSRTASRRLPRRALPLLAVGALALLLPFAADPAVADEGQWLPEQIEDFDMTALQRRGLELSVDELWDGSQGLLSAAVQINGCSASFVSEQGLIVTNHHCGFGAINAASTVETNYLRDGFISASMEEEIPAPGYRVSYVTGYEDVTAEMHAAAADAGPDPAEQARAVAAKRAALAQAAAGPSTSAIVVPYFEGREWRRILRTELRDVRLVYAPPRSVGEYGGETDNWMWPRHTGDFAFFRAYVAPDGSPADFDQANVPYSPPRHLEVAPDGVDEGDLVMIMGYPGRTERYLSSIAVASRESYYYPMRRIVFGEVIDALEEAGRADPELELQVQTTIKRFANAYKNADGMVWGLARNKVVARKAEEEIAFREWIAADPGLAARFDGVLDRLLALDLEEFDRQEKDFLLDQLRFRSGVVRGMVDQAMRGEEVAATTLEEARGPLASVDRRVLELLFGYADALPPTQRLADYDAWRKAGGSADDPRGLAMSLLADLGEQQAFRDRIRGLRQQVGPQWIEAQELRRGRSFYPDANSTLRLSVATVKGYEPRDGVVHVPFTTVDGMIAKHTGEGEFDVPLPIRQAVQGMPANGATTVNFLADGDTTGGNSGSAVVDGKGRLVGLNFDRVFENVSGDFGWNADRSRNISVDMQYVLWLMRDIWPSPRLLAEMGVDG